MVLKLQLPRGTLVSQEFMELHEHHLEHTSLIFAPGLKLQLPGDVQKDPKISANPKFLV